MVKKPNLDWELFAVKAWSLWNHRNVVKFGGQCKNAARITKEVADYMKEFRQESHSPGKCPIIPKLQWTPPRKGWYKINLDGAVFNESGSCGVGVVIRNENGCLMGAMSKRCKLPLKALETEALAVQEGIGLAWDLGLKKIEIESDSQLVVSALTKADSVPWSISKVIEGVRLSLRCFKAWKVTHTCREANAAAHQLARKASAVFDCNIWVEDIPPCIVEQVLYDVSNLVDVSD
nr:uncharacterized protein LOC111985003 [Quercus suber]